MNAKTLAAGSILLAGCLAASSAAIYYKIQSQDYQDMLECARAQLRDQPPLPDTIAPPGQPLAAAPATAPIPPITPAADPDTNRAARIQALEAALAERDLALQAFQRPVSMPGVEASTNRPRGRIDPAAWMESLKESDPDRYKQIQDARAEARRRTENAFAKKSAHLLQRDTAAMKEDEKATYNQMIQLLSDTWALSEKLRMDLPREERREAWQSLREKAGALDPLLKAERQREFAELAATVGYSEQDAPQFVQYLNDVIEVTTLQNLYGEGRGGPPGRGSGGVPGGVPGGTTTNRATAPLR